jgi:hypothetical protein
LISASQEAEITGVSHHTQLKLFFLKSLINCQGKLCQGLRTTEHQVFDIGNQDGEGQEEGHYALSWKIGCAAM